MPDHTPAPLTDQQLTALRPLAAVIETAIRETPVRLSGDDPATVLGGRLLADVAAYMGRTLGPDAPVLAEVQAERERQDAKWGEQNHRDGTGADRVWAFTGPASFVAECARKQTQELAEEGYVTWTDIALEEFAEAVAESDPARLRAELVQVAAVAVAWIGAIDRRAAAAAGEAGR
ncbi:NUDIX hydrolase [Streptomyces fumanus]|uniref:NUDIX hydrolase n=1 Tax=Streptomyces fumanus TaxID=67302 RepID=UPI0033F2DBF3